MNAFLVHHTKDISGLAQESGSNLNLIAHEDYLPLLLGRDIPCFFHHANYSNCFDEDINFLCHNWYREETGADYCQVDGLSLAETLSTGLLITVASVCREYIALKYWCDQYDCLYVSCNESAEFLRVAKTFGEKVRVYDPGHRDGSCLQSFSQRILRRPRMDWRASILRFFQLPFQGLLQNKTLALNDWTYSRVSTNSSWLIQNARFPWCGAYSRRPSASDLAVSEASVPADFDAKLTPVKLNKVLQRIDAHWDYALLSLLSEIMRARYKKYRYVFVETVAFYNELLEAYRPKELVIPSEFYEPYNLAAQLAKIKGIKVSWLVDGYPVVDHTERLGSSAVSSRLVDRIYAVANQHKIRLMRSSPALQEIVTITPPILVGNKRTFAAEKSFDAIVMTSTPYDLNVQGRGGAAPNTVIDALNIATSLGMKRLAVKIKHRDEKRWLLPLLEKTGYLKKIQILEGPFSKHIDRAKRVIGGISSAVGEAACRDIPYYVYEPISNGYSATQLASSVIIAQGGVATSPVELSQLLQRPEGSVIADRNLLFGTECTLKDWSWDQTRELYTDWVAEWPEANGIKTLLQWRGFPIWWSSNLVAKDTVVDYGWYQALHNRLCGSPSAVFRRYSAVNVYFKILKSLVKDLSKWLLVKIIVRQRDARSDRIWFHSLEYNLTDARDLFCDRNYESCPLDDRNHGFVSAYLIRLTIKNIDFMHPWKRKNKIDTYKEKLQREVDVLDTYLTLSDLVEVYLSLIKNYSSFQKQLKNWLRLDVHIKHAKFTDILIVEMQKSFWTALPWSLCYAAMFERWLKKHNVPISLITYGETLAPMRSVYYITKNQNQKHRWISIQHAVIYKNKMSLYHRYSEYNYVDSGDNRHVSPMPDFYFIHGKYYFEILTEFYPSDKIRIIGCLKYDSLYRKYRGSGFVNPCSDGPRLLVLAPSLGDEDILIKIFSGIRTLPGWKIVMSKHPIVSQEHVNKLIRNSEIYLTIETESLRSTTQLIEHASLVVSSYSSVGLEALFVGTPSARVLNPTQPPIAEGEFGITYLTNSQELLQLIEFVEGNEFSGTTRNDGQNTLDHFFYKFDGLATRRFWTELALLPT